MQSVWTPVYKLWEKSVSVKLLNFAKYMFDIFREKPRLLLLLLFFVKLLDQEHTFTLLFYEAGDRLIWTCNHNWTTQMLMNFWKVELYNPYSASAETSITEFQC